MRNYVFILVGVFVSFPGEAGESRHRGLHGGGDETGRRREKDFGILVPFG